MIDSNMVKLASVISIVLRVIKLSSIVIIFSLVLRSRQTKQII